MFKVTASCSFPYKYKTRQIYLTSGETLYLDEERDKDEIDYILSDYFPYRAFVYIEGKGVRKSGIQNDTLQMVPMLPLYDPYPNKMPPNYPARDAEENPHVIETLQAAGVVIPTSDRQAYNPAIAPSNPNKDLPVVEPIPEALTEQPQSPPKQTLEPEPNSKESRTEELKHMNNLKLRSIAKGYQIEVTGKQEMIDAILSVEFPE